MILLNQEKKVIENTKPIDTNENESFKASFGLKLVEEVLCVVFKIHTIK